MNKYTLKQLKERNEHAFNILSDNKIKVSKTSNIKDLIFSNLDTDNLSSIKTKLLNTLIFDFESGY